MSTATHRPARAVFLEGSILRHVLVMTASGSVGLISIFFVDLLTLIYISRLGDASMTAGIGLASQLSFAFISIQIGFSIGVTALVSQCLGRGDRDEAERIATSSVIHIGVISAAVSLAAVPFRRELAGLVGAQGETLEHASLFLLITLPSNAFLAIGMSMSGALRACGDARRSMYVTLAGAVVIAIMDPIFIIGLRWDVLGAGLSTFVSRVAIAAVGLWGVVYVHNLLRPVDWLTMKRCLKLLLLIAVPAMITNLAAPVANIYSLRIYAQFGDAVLAGFAVMDRIIPLAYGAMFAMSGAVGPIVGQNYGARQMDRVRAVLTNCYVVAGVYGLAVWAILWLASPFIVWLFRIDGKAADFVEFFCTYGAVGWLFLGWLFAANSAFNNLGHPVYATVFNWGRATLGVMPFMTLGAWWGGAHGALLGVAAGGAVFGVGAVAASYRLTSRLSARHAPDQISG
ncbi:MAG: MATE family efflux transporter [Hyphomicrobiales bacterium]|nr:MATE family efflux transporter [Hyphomicrobiales bacterium]